MLQCILHTSIERLAAGKRLPCIVSAGPSDSITTARTFGAVLGHEELVVERMRHRRNNLQARLDIQHTTDV